MKLICNRCVGDIKGIIFSNVVYNSSDKNSRFGVAIADFSQKMFMYEIGGNAIVFNFYTYLLSVIMMFVIFAITSKKNNVKFHLYLNQKSL